MKKEFTPIPDEIKKLYSAASSEQRDSFISFALFCLSDKPAKKNHKLKPGELTESDRSLIQAGQDLHAKIYEYLLAYNDEVSRAVESLDSLEIARRMLSGEMKSNYSKREQVKYMRYAISLARSVAK